jgi:hypothetical protein
MLPDEAGRKGLDEVGAFVLGGHADRRGNVRSMSVPGGRLGSVKRVDLRTILIEHQKTLLARLTESRSVLDHPGAKGSATELDWSAALEEFLPKRYQVSSAFVIDADGAQSEQIDLVVYDRHFCPLFFERGDARLIPVEAVFAAFEVRPKLDRENILYAAGKVQSVRELCRTDGNIVDRGQVRDPRGSFEIIGGLLALESSWTPAFGEPVRRALAESPPRGRLDYGCALRDGSFQAIYPTEGAVTLEGSEPEAALMFFLLRLYRSLQAIGSPMVIDLAEYGRSLEAPTDEGGSLP